MPRDHAAEFRFRAKELRAQAALTNDEKMRDIAIKCAEEYEKRATEIDRTRLDDGQDSRG